MRMSIRKDDPGYHRKAFRYQPYLDGEPLRNCFTADEDQGEAWVHETDEDGNLILSEEGTELKEKLMEGKVALRLIK